MPTDALDKVGLADRKHIARRNCPAGSSSGSRWRGRWSQSPALILGDEPTGNLDSRSSDEVVAAAAATSSIEWGRTLVMVTHDPRIAAYADRIVFLKDGQIVDENHLRGQANADQTPRAVEPRCRELGQDDKTMKTSTWIQMTRMAWQYLKGRKLRTALTTLAIVLGVALIFAINLICPACWICSDSRRKPKWKPSI